MNSRTDMFITFSSWLGFQKFRPIGSSFSGRVCSLLSNFVLWALVILPKSYFGLSYTVHLAFFASDAIYEIGASASDVDLGFMCDLCHVADYCSTFV